MFQRLINGTRSRNKPSVIQQLNIDTACANHDHGSKLVIIDHAETELNAVGDHGRHQHPGPEAAGKIEVGMFKLGFVFQVKPYAIGI